MTHISFSSHEVTKINLHLVLRNCVEAAVSKVERCGYCNCIVDRYFYCIIQINSFDFYSFIVVLLINICIVIVEFTIFIIHSLQYSSCVDPTCNTSQIYKQSNGECFQNGVQDW